MEIAFQIWIIPVPHRQRLLRLFISERAVQFVQCLSRGVGVYLCAHVSADGRGSCIGHADEEAYQEAYAKAE